MKKLLVTAPLILMVLLSSGCTIPGGSDIPFLSDIFGGTQVNEQRHDVISIESLQAIPSTTTREGQNIRLRAVVKNLQAPEYEPTYEVNVSLFNDCDMFDTSVSFCQNGDKIDKNGLIGCGFRSMQPQSTQIVEWTLNAKEVNVETQCKIGIMAQYYYTTYSTSSVTFINRAEVERLVSEGKSFSETGIASIGEGPVKSYIEVSNQPIIIDTSKTGKDAGSGIMSFWITNRGNGLLDFSGGKIYTENNKIIDDPTYKSNDMKGNTFFPDAAGLTKGCDSLDYKYRPQICINIKSDLIWYDKKGNPTTINKCIQSHIGELKTQNDSSLSGKFNLNFIQKSTPKYSCSVTVPDPTRIKQEKTYQITSQIGYNYKFVKEITVKVQPKVKV